MKFRLKTLKTLFFTLFLLSGLGLSGQLLAQKTSVNGKVVDNQGASLPGVSIIVKGTTIGTLTDINGSFTIALPADAKTLVFSFVGMKTVEVPVDAKTNFNVVMEFEAYGLNEVLVTGYQKQKRADITGAIDVVETKTLTRSSASNPLEALQGQMPGTYVTTSGAPGASVQILIRGMSTLGNTDPLFIVDGMPTKNGVDNIDASSIESIQVLKDAAAASIYGSRASNGVVIIETKKGTKNEVTFDSQITFQKYQDVIPVLNTLQRGQAEWQAAINEGVNPNDHPLYDYDWGYDSNGNPVLNKVMPIEWISEALGIKAANTNWWKEVTRPGFIERNELTLSSGGKQGGSRLSISQYNDKGVFINDDFRKFNVDLNSHYKFLNDKIEIGENIVVTSSLRHPDVVRGDALTTQSIIPVRTVDGKGWGGPYGAGFEDWMQPVMESYINSWDNTKTERLMGSGYMSVDLTKNLQFKTNIGVESINSTWTDYQRPYVSGFMHRDVANFGVNKDNTFNWSLSNTFNYNIVVNQHVANVLVGTEMYRNTEDWINAYADDFAADQKDYYTMDAAVGTHSVSGSSTGYSLLSYFGKVNYNYADKYLLSGTLRYDGSSRFGKDNRFGTFPSVSVGWRMDKENFIKNNFAFVSMFKPRYGLGVVGNQEIGNDASLALYQALYGIDYTWFWDTSTSYDLNGSDSGNLPSGYRRLKEGNSKLKWESTTENNAGFDYGFFNQTIFGSFDYYVRKSKDILIQPPYLGAIGEGGNTWYNGATVENRGFEFSMTYRKSVGAFSYVITGNAGHFKDKITYLPDEVVKAYAGNTEQTILGHSQRALFGYVADGLFQNQAEVDASAAQTGKDIGRIRYKDLNNDGVINSLDQKFLGTTLPGLIYGLNFDVTYKNWSVNLFFNGEAFKNIYNSTKAYTDFIFERAGVNYGTRVLDAWTPQNTGSSIPALITSDKNNEFRSSSYFIENGSYMKVRNFEVNYKFNFTGSSLRVFVRGENLLQFKAKGYTGPDPENPNNGYGRPIKLTLGAHITI